MKRRNTVMSGFSRHATAIKRSGLPQPTVVAIKDGVIRPGLSVFDYGEGKGDQCRLLREQGYKCNGWDPYWNKSAPVRPADVVTLNFVLNTIESPKERIAVLKAAAKLAKRRLVVAVRPDTDPLPATAVRHGDGWVIQGAGGVRFQKFYSSAALTSELRQARLTVNRVKRCGQGCLLAYVEKE